MKKNNIVKKQYEFNDIINTGKKKKNECFIVYYKKNSYNKARFGITVSKKQGNAVYRNLYKRRIKNIIDLNKNNFEKPFDYIIIMKKVCSFKSFKEIQESLNKILLDIIKGEEDEKK